MAQGKPFDQKRITESLKEYFVLGYSRYKACKYGGFDTSLLAKWEKKDPTLSLKIDMWIGQTNVRARKNWKAVIEDGEYTPSKDWLERVEKDDFSTKQETDNLNTNLNTEIISEESKEVIDKYIEEQGGQEIPSE